MHGEGGNCRALYSTKSSQGCIGPAVGESCPGRTSLELGAWSLEPGAWSLAPGARCRVSSPVQEPTPGRVVVSTCRTENCPDIESLVKSHSFVISLVRKEVGSPKREHAFIRVGVISIEYIQH